MTKVLNSAGLDCEQLESKLTSSLQGLQIRQEGNIFERYIRKIKGISKPLDADT